MLTGWQLDDVLHLSGRLDQIEQEYVDASVNAANAAQRAREREMVWREDLKLSAMAPGVNACTASNARIALRVGSAIA